MLSLEKLQNEEERRLLLQQIATIGHKAKESMEFTMKLVNIVSELQSKMKEKEEKEAEIMKVFE